MAAGWSAQTEVGFVLFLIGLVVAFFGHRGGSNGLAGVGWLLMIAGFVVAISN